MQVIVDPLGGRSNLDTTPAAFSGPIGIELRAHASMQSPKKQYGRETRNASGSDLPVSLLGMPAEADWILQGPYRDKIMFRNAFAYELSRRIGRYAARTRFVEAFVDETGSGDMVHHYVGLYVLMERIKRSDRRVDITASAEPSSAAAAPPITSLRVRLLTPRRYMHGSSSSRYCLCRDIRAMMWQQFMTLSERSLKFL